MPFLPLAAGGGASTRGAGAAGRRAAADAPRTGRWAGARREAIDVEWVCGVCVFRVGGDEQARPRKRV